LFLLSGIGFLPISAIVYSQPVSELSARAREVFRMVVEGYLGSGAPIGSRTIARYSSLNLSPASIRTVMQDLEEMGLLAAPHTSAGRVPTESGLRLFVDAMMQATEPSESERAAIEAQASGRGPVEEALAATSAVLSGLSSCAGIVVAPRGEPVLRQLSFVPLSGRRAVAILVGADGSIENRVVDLPAGVDPIALAEASNYVEARLAGLTLPDAEARLREEIAQGRSALDITAQRLVAKGLAIWSEDGGRRPVMIVRGQANLIDPPLPPIWSACASCSTRSKARRRSSACSIARAGRGLSRFSSDRKTSCSRYRDRRLSRPPIIRRTAASSAWWA